MTTADRILDSAERMVQARGFNAFSFADIARELGIAKAGLYHHFPTKAGLGTRLVERYAARFMAALRAIEDEAPHARDRLLHYIALYDAVLREDRMCLFGMLSAEFVTLAVPMRAALTHFFDANQAWLVAVLDTGRQQGELHFPGAASDVARVIVSGLEGAMMLARFRGDPTDFDTMARRLVGDLAGGTC